MFALLTDQILIGLFIGLVGLTAAAMGAVIFNICYFALLSATTALDTMMSFCMGACILLPMDVFFQCGMLVVMAAQIPIVFVFLST